MRTNLIHKKKHLTTNYIFYCSPVRVYMDYCCNKQNTIADNSHLRGSVINCFAFKIKLFCFVASMTALVHDVEAVHGICLLLTVFRNYFRNMCDAHEYANGSFTGKPTTHISKNISRCCNQFVRKSCNRLNTETKNQKKNQKYEKLAT